jgi:DNA/RNA-binding domain of Phe-tRNA-synthetase-like protein
VQTLSFSIADDVFARFPGYVRGVVLAHGVTNGPSPAELVALLRAAEDEVRRSVEAATIAEYPRIRSWREAFRAFGAKPSEYRSSIEALARRVTREDSLPTINALVDIGNVISLRHLLPAGAHAIDELTDAAIGRSGTLYLTDRSQRFPRSDVDALRSSSAPGGVLSDAGSRPLRAVS